MLEAPINRGDYGCRPSKYCSCINLLCVYRMYYRRKNNKSKCEWKEMRYILLILAVFICGCCFTRSTEIRTSAYNIESVYGNGNANIEYKSNTEWRFLNGR